MSERPYPEGDEWKTWWDILLPDDCPLPDAEDAEQYMIIGVDFAGGPDRTAYWPNNDADIAADAEDERDEYAKNDDLPRHKN